MFFLGLARVTAVLAPLPGLVMLAVAYLAEPSGDFVEFCVVYWRVSLIAGFAVSLTLGSAVQIRKWALGN